MKTLALFAIDFERASTVGLREKTIGLIKAGRAEGIDIDMMALTGSNLLIWRAVEPEPSLPNLVEKSPLVGAYRSYHMFWRKLFKHVDFSLYDVLWWRDHPPSRSQVNFIKKAKQSGLYLIRDIPTYPKDLEGRGFRGWFLKQLAFKQSEIALVTDMVLTSSPDEMIDGCKTTHVSNGIDESSIQSASGRSTGPLRIVGIGQWAFWHGIDRLFLGVARAQLQDSFVFDFAGEGPGIKELKALASSLSLNVEWRGPIWGKRRTEMLNDADAAIGALAPHRKNVIRDRALKHRLYVAAGLPVILTKADDEMCNAPLVSIVESGESVVDAVRLKKELFAFRENHISMREAQRKFGKQFSWRSAYDSLWNLLK